MRTSRRASGSGSRTCSTRRSCARRSPRRSSRSSSSCPVRPRPELDLRAMTEEYLRCGHRLSPTSPTPRGSAGRCSTAAARCSSRGPGDDARPRPRHLSVRHLVDPVAGSACVGAGVGPTDIDEVWGVCKATRPGRAGPFPDRAHRHVGADCVTADTSSARRPAASVAAAGSISSRCATRPGSTGSGAGDHEARRALRPRPAADRGPLSRQRGRRLRPVPLPPVDPPHREPRVRRASGWEDDISAARSESDLPRRLATTSPRSPTAPACRSASSGSARDASR